VTAPGSSDHWARLEKLFYQALDIAPDARSAFLDEACRDNPELRKEVESLLASSNKPLDLLRGRVDRAMQRLTVEDLGQRVGPYRLIGRLGEGGMGKVYLASRADKLYEQEVAIKLMHPGLTETQGMLLRFGVERQILANLNHPNIARLLDGGITQDGAPYLVMEYIKGIRIDGYCREHDLKIEERLRLFLSVCGAVEFAHKNLVVHRDIKPANILVTPEGVPKLLDFGIAKLLSPDPDSPTLTRTTDRLMTPEYASPEQIRGDQITTSTDVYALGVLLYELLTGTRPFHLETKSPLDIARIICEQDPQPPSAIALSRTGGEQLARQLRGDLDNIVAMALRKEPARRYSSVAAISADVQAYLQGYPVHARTDTWRYRSGKFVRRHKAATIATTLVAVSLVGFSIGMSWLARRANRERATAQRESQFLASIFQAATPDQARGRQVTARELLDAGALRIDRELADQPLLQASMADNIGQAYISLGAYEQAQKLFQRAYDLRRNNLGPNAIDTVQSLSGLAMSFRLQDNCKAAEPLFRQVLAVQQKTLGANSQPVAETLENVGECLYLESRWNEAEPLLRQSLAIKRRLNLQGDSSTWNFLALVLERKGDYAEALPLLHEAVDNTRRAEGTDGPNYVVALHNLASAMIDSGDLYGAEATERETLQIRRRILGNQHPDLFYSLNNLAWILLQEGNWRESEPFLQENLALVRKDFGEQSSKMVFVVKNWGLFLQEKGDYAGAEKSDKAALQTAIKAAGPSSWQVERILAGLGELEFDRGHYAAAESYARQALDLSRKLGGEGNPEIATVLIDLAEDRVFQKDSATAEPMLREAVRIREEKLNPGNPPIITAEVRLGEDLTLEAKAAEAEPTLRKALNSLKSEPFRVPRWQIAEAESALGACLVALKNPDGEKMLRESQADLGADPRPAFRIPADHRAALFRDSSNPPRSAPQAQ
jgi:eukaryotic-like serine/threonine-protein kinase